MARYSHISVWSAYRTGLGRPIFGSDTWGSGPKIPIQISGPIGASE